MRNLLDHILDHRDALGPAESSEGGVRRKIRAADATGDSGIRKIIAVVRVHHRPLEHGRREIGRAAAVGEMIDDQRRDPAGRVEADLVPRFEIVPLASDGHIVVAAQHDSRRPLGERGDDRGHRGDVSGLRLLPAESAAEPPAEACNAVVRQPADFGHDGLHFAGVLRRGVHDHAAALFGINDGGLRLKVKMFLAADRETAFD